MGRIFPGGRNRPRGLSLIVYDDDLQSLLFKSYGPFDY